MILELNGTKVTIVDKTLGYQGDNLVDTIQVTVDKDSTWNYKLDMYKGKSKCFDSVLMTREGNICTVQLTNEILSYGGRYIFQLRGYTDTQTYHSDIFESWVNASIEYQDDCKQGDCECDCKLPTEFYQVEDNVTEINNHPPYPGDNNKWMIWDVNKHEYVESDIEVIAGGEDYQTKANLTTSITAESTDTQYPSAKATYDAIDEVKADILQPDYNQNDETAKDYIKNRPFYTGDPVETVLVEESTVAFIEAEGLYGANFPSTFEATIGDTYKVSWDGTVYECTCVAIDDTYTIGNLSIVGASSDTGEPFIMGIMNGEGIVIFTADTSASHTFSISRMVVPVVKIDKKYLVQPDWNQNDETAADFVKNRPFYSETGNVTVKNAVDVELERFPVFAVGDTVTVNVDGVEHSLVAYDDEGYATIGDPLSSIQNGEGQLGWLITVNPEDKTVWFYATKPHTVSYLGVDYYHKIDPKYLPEPFKPAGNSYLTFSSPNSFVLAVNDAIKYWNGTIEYFDSDKTWIVWDGTTTLSAVADYDEYVLYLRGSGNTVITGNNLTHKWILTGTDIKCIGNIENLLDYTMVESGEHPTMADYCYQRMFYNCTALIQAPALPATTLASNCYQEMFWGCTSLTQAPTLPAVTLAEGCYYAMFSGCASLTQPPALPATTLASTCYRSMFQYCTSLTQAPALPATTLARTCYADMFSGCSALIQAPALPATTLASTCYADMFSGCSALIQAPALPATTLASTCYRSMFQYCTSLTQAPALPAVTLADYCYANMFYGCSGIKLSSTKTDEYTQEYRVPSSGNGVTATYALDDMFASTGGTFTGTPTINTTYYLSSDNIVVRETEVATLNGYVGSMIDDAIQAAKPDIVTPTAESTDTQAASAKAVWDSLPTLKTWTAADLEATT